MRATQRPRQVAFESSGETDRYLDRLRDGKYDHDDL